MSHGWKRLPLALRHVTPLPDCPSTALRRSSRLRRDVADMGHVQLAPTTHTRRCQETHTVGCPRARAPRRVWALAKEMVSARRQKFIGE